MIKTLLTAILLSILSVTAMAEHENTPTPAPEQEQNPSAFMKEVWMQSWGPLQSTKSNH